MRGGSQQTQLCCHGRTSWLQTGRVGKAASSIRVGRGTRSCRGTGSGVQRGAGGRTGCTHLLDPNSLLRPSPTGRIYQPVSVGSAPDQDLKTVIEINSSCLLLRVYLVPGSAPTLSSLLYNLYNFVKWVLSIYRKKLRQATGQPPLGPGGQRGRVGGVNNPAPP